MGRRAPVVALGLLLAAACGDDGGTSGDDTTTTGGGASSTSMSAVDSSGAAAASSSSGAASTSTGGDTTTGGTGTGSSGTAGESSGGSESTGGAVGLGMIDGECGLIDMMELTSPSPFQFENGIDFRLTGFDYDQLTPGAQAVYDAGNLGGSSLESETISFEVLARCEGAQLLATEAEILYLDPMGKKTDLRVEIDGLPVGVSVTRAVGFPPEDPYDPAQAEALLTGKLDDILASTANVDPADAWSKQILHVIAYADMHAASIFTAYATLPPEVTADTILLVTVTDGNDAFIY